MWKIRRFKDQIDLEAWAARNEHRYQIVMLFVSGYAVKYKRRENA